MFIGQTYSRHAETLCWAFLNAAVSTLLGPSVISLQAHASILLSRPICCSTSHGHIAVASAEACCSRYTRGDPLPCAHALLQCRLSCTRPFFTGPKKQKKTKSICISQGLLRKTRLLKDTSQRFTILDTMSSILYPGRFTLLLGPPGAGKTTLLNALSGRLHKSPNIDVSDSFPSPLHVWDAVNVCRCVL